MRKRALAEERNSWGWWVHLLVVGLFWGIPVLQILPEVMGGGPGKMSRSAALVLFFALMLLPILIYAFLGQLRVRVTSEGVEAAWGFLEVFKKRFPFGEIVEVEAVTYSPLREFGGWGIRFGAGSRKAWTIRGNRALVLHLKNGTRFYLTSERPERLVMNIRSAGAGKMGGKTETEGDKEG